MFKFGKFKSSFNVYNGTVKGGHQEHVSYGTTSVIGAYRVNRNELPLYSNSSGPHGKVSDAAPVPPKNPPVLPKIPPQKIPDPVRETQPSKDVIKNKNLPPSISQAQSGVSLNPQGAASEPRRNSRGPSIDPHNGKTQLDAHKRVEKKRLEEQKKLEKKRLDEQKKLEKKQLEEQKKSQKLALQEQAKQEKLRKEREKKETRQLKQDKKKKKTAPQKPLTNPLAQPSTLATNPTEQQSGASYSTNTLNSSISKTSGPPPYSEVSQQERRELDTNSNVQFSKPEDTSSWDLVSQHRQNVNRHANPAQSVKGKTTMDLNFNLGDTKSDA